MNDDIIKEGPKIHIEIGELVLHGFDYHAKHIMVPEIEKELGRLIKENGLPQFPSNNVNQKHDLVNKQNKLPNTKSVGSQVAYSIYGNLTKNMMNHKRIEDNNRVVDQLGKIKHGK